MDHEIKARLKWINLYETFEHAGIVCRRCGISRPTLRKWLKRYRTEGIEGLKNRSRKPHSSPNLKVDDEKEQWILDLRVKHNLGARRIQNELKRLYSFSLSLSTIHKILNLHNVAPLRKPPRKKRIKRYSKKIPGECVQVDTCKIAPGFYQYTAVDDCTRYQVLEIYSRRTAQSTIDFFEKVIEEMPFPIQRIQTDRGSEFFAYKVQEWMMDNFIKFRPIKPGSPHLNGKVERAQKTDLYEFYGLLNNENASLRSQLADWQHYYNWERIHGAIGKPPIDRFFELQDITPYWNEIVSRYDPAREIIREKNYKMDLRLVKLK